MNKDRYWKFNLWTTAIGLTLVLVAFFMPKEINAIGVLLLLAGYFVGQIKLK